MASGLGSFGFRWELVTVENKVINIRVPKYAWNFLSGLATAGFSRMIQLHGARQQRVQMSDRAQAPVLSGRRKECTLRQSYSYLCHLHVPVLFSIVQYCSWLIWQRCRYLGLCSVKL
jgi:hypothetical protein